jgi:SAM-dependent methyltransferase
MSGSGEAARFWEDHYGARERVWSGRANPVLVDVVGPMEPGSALDLGCGEGGDAIWLAQQGWRVIAVDVSATALARASEEAVTDGVADRIEFQRHDLATSFPKGHFDLVSAQYLHSPVEFPRERVLRSGAEAVAPGGLLLVVGHAWTNPRTRLPAAKEVLAGLELDPGRWSTERVGSYEREATGRDGQAVTHTDNVVAVRRLAR